MSFITCIFSSVNAISFCCGTTARLGRRRPRCRDFQLKRDWIQTPTRLSLKERAACRRGFYLHDTQQTQGTGVRVISGIRTRNPTSQAGVKIGQWLLLGWSNHEGRNGGKMRNPYTKSRSLKKDGTWRSRSRWEWNNGIHFNEVGIGMWAVLQWLRLGEHGSWKTLIELWVPLKVWRCCYLSYCYLPPNTSGTCILLPSNFFLLRFIAYCRPVSSKNFNETCQVGRPLLSVGTFTVGGILRRRIDIERTNSC